MDMKRKEKGNEHKKIRSQMHRRKKDIRRKYNVTKSLCHDDCDDSVDDISNVRCHGWDMGTSKD